MAEDKQGTITLAEATTRVLDAEGTKILQEPQRFAQMVCNATGNAQTPQIVLFSRNCDKELLDPFVKAAVDKGDRIQALQDAASKVAGILQEDRGIIPDLSNDIAGQLMAGIVRYVRSADTPVVPANPSGEGGHAPKEPTPTVEADNEKKPTPNKKGNKKTVPLIAAIAAGVLIVAILVWVLVVPQFRARVSLYDHYTGKSETTPLEGWKGGTVVLPEAISDGDGGEFSGWTTSSDTRKGVVLAPGTEVKIEDASVYYAVWDPKVSFDGNGATEGSMEATIVKQGEKFELPECKYTKEGHVFAGWLSPSDEEDAPYAASPGNEVNAFESTTYRAKWIPKPNIVELSITGLDEKSGTIDGWDPKTGLSAILVKNDTKENVRLEATTTFQSEAGNKVTDYTDYVNSMAPGETVLVAWSTPSGEKDVAKVAYTLKASKSYDWAQPLNGVVKHEVISKENGELKLKLTNTGKQVADIEHIDLIAKDKAGNPYICKGLFLSELNPGESAEVTFDNSSSVVYNVPIPAWDQLECTFYINGYCSTD